MLTNRILRFLHDKSQKDKAEYDRFYRDYGIFLKEGIITSHEQLEKVNPLNINYILFMHKFVSIFRKKFLNCWDTNPLYNPLVKKSALQIIATGCEPGREIFIT